MSSNSGCEGARRADGLPPTSPTVLFTGPPAARVDLAAEHARYVAEAVPIETELHGQVYGHCIGT
jgi:hypothetical protein